jgi:transposase-like protein
MSATIALDEFPRRWTADHASRVLAALDDSRLPVAEFARRHRIDAQRLHSWRRRLSPAAPARLVELVPRATAPASVLEVACPSGHVVRVRDGANLALVADILRILGDIPC